MTDIEKMRQEMRDEWLTMLRNFNQPSHNPSWSSSTDIIQKLNMIAESAPNNRIFLPGSGSGNLIRASISHENGCIELQCGGIPEVVRPSILKLEYFASKPESSYLRLDCHELLPRIKSGESDRSTPYERVFEMSPGEYVDASQYYAENQNVGENARPVHAETTKRLMSRLLRGSFIIVGHSSNYNLAISTSDGRHGSMPGSDFRRLVESDF